MDNTGIFYLFRKTTEMQFHFLKENHIFSGLHIVNTADIDNAKCLHSEVCSLFFYCITFEIKSFCAAHV